MSDARITIGADMSDFRHDFALANQFAEQRLKEFRANARGHFDGFVADAGAKAKSAAGHVGAGAEKMSSAVERAASLMGGAFGDVADITLDLGGKMGSLAGPIGVATAAVAGLGYAAVQLAGYADEAAKRLEDAGLAAIIPAEAAASVEDYRSATRALRTETDLLAVSLGGPLLSAVGNLSSALVGIENRLQRAAGPAQVFAASVSDAMSGMVGRGLLALGTGGGSEVARFFSGRIETIVEKGEQIADMRETEAAGAKLVEEMLSRSTAAAEDVADARDREADAAAKATAAARERAAAAAAEKAASDALASQLADELAVRRSLQDQRARDAAETARLAASEATFNTNTAQVAATSAGLGDLSAAIDEMGPKIGIAAMKGLLPILTGGGAGVLEAVGAAGPFGAALVGLTQLPSMLDGLQTTLSDLTQTFEDLPDLLRTALSETVPDILRSIPDLVTAILDLVIDLPSILIEAIPDILAGLIEAIPELIIAGLQALPEMIALVFVGLPKAFAEAIAGVITGPLTDKEGRFLGTDLRAEGGRSLFGIDLPSFARGTSEVTRTGVAVVHRGEEIRRSGMERGGPGAAPVINVHGGDTREIVRQIRELLGGDYGPSYGTGDRL